MSDDRDEDGIKGSKAQTSARSGYIENIDEIRQIEFPNLHNTTYLDHAGTTPYASSLINAYTSDLKDNLFGNPHSGSASSHFTSKRIDDTRLEVLRYFNADPDDFEVVFVANATAGIKLVAEAFRDQPRGFSYTYHEDAHTSLVGVRELARNGSVCMGNAEMDSWLENLNANVDSVRSPVLFAYPGQSNMTGQRYSLDWCSRIRQTSERAGVPLYTLYDAAALLSTGSLDLSQPEHAPDFTVLSFYKIFGFPDLGALIVRKASGDILRYRKYFGGGTVDMASVYGVPWHVKKLQLHSSLEDGTLPFHTIVALDHAITAQQKIFGDIGIISRHTHHLVSQAYQQLRLLRHGNGNPVCRIYSPDPSAGAVATGPIIAFNLLDGRGKWISNPEVEKLSIVNGIQLRIGGLCNPGGTSKYLDLSTEIMKRNYAAGQRCGGDVDIYNNAPTGSIRISFGASSSLADVESFVAFLSEFFVTMRVGPPQVGRLVTTLASTSPRFSVASLSIFPIKSCAAFKIPANIDWEVLSKGLQWDREWCLVHQGTNTALSQKQFPRMALIRPTIDLSARQLIVSFSDNDTSTKSISIELDGYPGAEGVMRDCKRSKMKRASSTICGESVVVHLYTSKNVCDFFSDALGVSCTLARFPQDGPERRVSIRRPASMSTPESSPERGLSDGVGVGMGSSINLSNESPILLISQSSVDELNRQIELKSAASINNSIGSEGKLRSKTVVTVDSFRGNIVIAEIGSRKGPTHEIENDMGRANKDLDRHGASHRRPGSRSKQDNDDNSEDYNKEEDDSHQSITKSTKSSTDSAQETSIRTIPSRRDHPYVEDTFRSLHIRNRTTGTINESDSDAKVTLNVLGPCQRCQMVCVQQDTGKRSSEPFSTLAKTRRKDGRVWFGMHLSLFPSPTTTALSGEASTGTTSQTAMMMGEDSENARSCTDMNRNMKGDQNTRMQNIDDDKTRIREQQQQRRRFFIRVGDPVDFET